ncbi:hypothetical protein D3C72_1582280 [compost metagenome]
MDPSTLPVKQLLLQLYLQELLLAQENESNLLSAHPLPLAEVSLPVLAEVVPLLVVLGV